MRLIAAAILATTTLAALAQAQAPVQPAFTAEAFRAHVDFLADDLLEGRDTGTRGYDIAARYVATRFEALGLTPGSRGGWYQQVPFALANLSGEPPRVTIGGRVFLNDKDVIVAPTALEASQRVEAPVVFAGYGFDSPADGFDDYRGLDVRGKIVAVLSGSPKGTPSEMGAHLNAEKARMAEARGAVGVVTIPTRADAERRPWARRVELSRGPAMNWIGADSLPFSRAPGVRVGATLDTAAAVALFAGSRRSLSAILDEAARDGGKPKGFALTPVVRIERQSAISRVYSPNVVAILPGSDPALANEHILLMAHLDHEGVEPGATVSGDRMYRDRIYNGAMDNATGVATLLEVARAMAAAPTRPKRSILFAAVTAEEDGLLGSEYLARNPVVGPNTNRPGKVVGVVNLDMPVLLYDFQDVIAFGADHSTLGPIVARAVAQANVKLSPDPLPQENLFTRSDHYRFVQAGIPSVFLMTGFAGEGRKQFTDFLATHYHKVSDAPSLPIEWAAGAKFARINYLIAREIADAPDAPRWYADSFFGKAVGGNQPRATRASR